MRYRLAAIALPLAFAASALASTDPIGGMRELGPTAETFREAMTAHERSTRHGLNILREGPSDVMVIHGAANAAGQFGAYYRTDLYLMSAGTASSGTGVTVFRLFVLPEGGTNNPAITGTRYEIAAGGRGIVEDVVGKAGVFGAATLIVLVDQAQSTVSQRLRAISAWGRTYTAGGGGDYATTLPVIAGWNLNQSSQNFVCTTGIQQNSRRRTNVSFFNHSLNGPATVRVVVFDQNGSLLGEDTVTIPAAAALQFSLSRYTIVEPGGSMRALLTSGSAAGVSGFAVVVNNATNDGEARLLTYNEF